MPGWFRSLDDLLRGERTNLEALSDGTFVLPLRKFLPIAIGLGATYGFFMGWYAISGRGWAGAQQMIASMVKIPALFLLTLVVSFPSLYVFNALMGCRMGLMAALRLAVAAIVVALAVGASFGPIVAFFTLSTTSYPFMVLLNVALLGIAGAIGLGFLLGALRRLTMATRAAQADESSNEMSGESGPTARKWAREELEGERSAMGVFRVWVVIYALVGAQMGWLLRPFIGHPAMAFEWLRARDGNFVLGVIEHLRRLFEQ